MPDDTASPGPTPPPVPADGIVPAGNALPPWTAIASGTPPLLPPDVVAVQTAAPPPSVKTPAKEPLPHDSFREFIETVVFVVVLVLILKTFLAEAFVIPTGSMATTLLGYHKEVKCEQCGYRFLVNSSKEADPAENEPQWVIEATCPNCMFHNALVPRHQPGGPLPGGPMPGGPQQGGQP